ncbi:hypothetical protein PVAND_004240 [Polypedilum vanderplanki]|uniref:C2H2-type domain-containing protein n=1 Tax=Polypedilum vanderplanki TaxID=319348 RepID=A0A9J6BWJ2_POLVA|nr:hypothetical protein PVAND_004240 [Polypedilum vanderplanki]
MQIKSVESYVDFQPNSPKTKLELEEVFYQRFRQIKITPTNENYNQILNMGFVKINENRRVFSCFIGICHFKARTIKGFQNHINNFHCDDKKILKNFCLICETFQCGESLNDELCHMIDHINGVLFTNNEANYFIKREIPMEIIEANEETVEVQEIQTQLPQIVSVTTIQSIQDFDYLEESTIPTQIENVEESIKIQNYDVNISSDFDQTSSLLELLETPSFKMPQIPIRKAQIRNRSQSVEIKTTARKSTATINARRSTVDFFNIKVKEEPKESSKLEDLSIKRPFHKNKINSRRMILETDRPMTHCCNQQVKKTFRSSTIKTSNKKLDATECFSYIKKKIENNKNREDKFANFKPNLEGFLESELENEKSPKQITLDCLSFISKEIKKSSNEKLKSSRANGSSDEKLSSNSSEQNSIKKRKIQSENSQPHKVRKVEDKKYNFTYEAIMAVPRENSENRVARYLENLENLLLGNDKEDVLEVPESYEDFASSQRNRIGTSRKAATAQLPIKKQVKKITADEKSDLSFEHEKDEDEMLHFDKTIASQDEKPKNAKQPLQLTAMLDNDSNDKSNGLKFQSLIKLYPWIDEKNTRTVFKTLGSIDVLLTEICQFSTYKCMNEVCIFFTTDFDEFKRHIMTQHSDANCHYCCFCLESYNKTAELSSHIDMTHRYDRFQCNQCMYRSCQKSYVAVHQKKFHPKVPCMIFKSPVQKLLKNVMKKAEESMVKNREQFVTPYRCKTPRCKESFYCKVNFKKHLEAEAIKPSCTEFVSIIVEQLYEIDHQRTFNNLEGFTQCLYCKFGTDDNNILEHMSLKHQSEFAFICKRVMPTYIVARETLVTHTLIEQIKTHAETIEFEGNLEDLKSEKIVVNIQKEPEVMKVPEEKFYNEIICIDN